jgi:dTDP-4-dehydrorhamnose 3,5-epimerase
MKVIATTIPDVLILEPRVFEDERGFFLESYSRRDFQQETGLDPIFVQDNHSRSARNVLRGLHYQVCEAQAKLIRVISGEIFDVAVDLRKNSPTFSQWVGTYLSAENRRMLWIPEGFAHGFIVISDYADCLYKATAFYALKHERCIRWDDPTLAIAWPLAETPLLSAKDAAGSLFKDAEYY